MAHQNYYKSAAPTPSIVCPAPMTRAALLALKNANGLTKDCDYVVTDHVQGRIAAGTLIHLQAVNANTLSDNVQVDTLFDSTAWRGLYDIDTGIIYELEDSRNNVARGIAGSEVSAFDWGNPAYSFCHVERATWNVTNGSAAGRFSVKVISAALDTTGHTGILDDVVLTTQANVRLNNSACRFSACEFSNSVSFSGQDYTATTTYANNKFRGGAFDMSAMDGVLTMNDNEFDFCTIAIRGAANATINRNKSVNLTLTRATPSGVLVYSNNTTKRRSFINLDLAGACTFTQSAIETGMAVQFGGTLRVTGSTLETNSTINNQGTGLIQVNNSHMHGQSAQLAIAQGSTANITVEQSVIHNSLMSILGAVGGGTLSINSSYLMSGSSMYKRTVGGVGVSNSVISNGSLIDNQSGDRGFSITGTTVSAGTVLGLATGAALTDTILDSTITNKGNIVLRATGATANQVVRCVVNGVQAAIDIRGTSSGQIISDSTLDNANFNILDCPVAMTHTQNQLSSIGSITLNNVTANKPVQSCSVRNSATIRVQAATVAGAITSIDCTNGGTYDSTATAGTANRVLVTNGRVFHNGGNLLNCEKSGQGTLITGAFNHDNIMYDHWLPQTLTVANSNRGRNFFQNTLV